MNRLSLVLAPLIYILASVCTAGTTQSVDDASIRQLENGQAAAWNHHDAKAYAALFSEEGDVVNVLGWWWQGRSQIQSKLEAAFSVVFRNSTLTIVDVKTRFLTPDIAVVHVRWTMTGARSPPGVPPPTEGIQLQVVRRHGSTWLIESFQNTNGVPERPFPLAPAESVNIP
jgi:uncharacterized protein (TIGR02246 family)